MKTVTLRLEDDVVEALNSLQIFYGETTTNKTAARVIQLHKKLYENNQDLKKQVSDLSHELKKIQGAVYRFKEAQKELMSL